MTARRLDAGAGTTIEIREYTGAGDGPTVAVLGGVHGDELEGVLAVRSVTNRLAGAMDAAGRLTAGRVLAVAVANPPAHAARTRTTPADGGNLARTFPGRPDGTVTERLADALTHHVIRPADLLIDLHSAGQHYAMPFFAGYCLPDGEAPARAFGAPLLWAHEGVNPGRSLAAAAAYGVAAIYVEGSGGAALRRTEVVGYVDGVLRVLGSFGMVADPPALIAVERVLRGGDGDVDSSVSATVDGWCVTSVAAGATVTRGEAVADIVDARGEVAQRIRAPHDGTVMMLRRTAEVTAGTGIVMLGPPASAA